MLNHIFLLGFSLKWIQAENKNKTKVLEKSENKYIKKENETEEPESEEFLDDSSFIEDKNFEHLKKWNKSYVKKVIVSRRFKSKKLVVFSDSSKMFLKKRKTYHLLVEK
jgi:hypothetical protein